MADGFAARSQNPDETVSHRVTASLLLELAVPTLKRKLQP